jgi:hypothetical protein
MEHKSRREMDMISPLPVLGLPVRQFKPSHAKGRSTSGQRNISAKPFVNRRKCSKPSRPCKELTRQLQALDVDHGNS